MALKSVVITPGLSIHPKYNLTHLIAYVLIYELRLHVDDAYLSEHLSAIEYAGDNAARSDIEDLSTELYDVLLGKCVVTVRKIRSICNAHYRIYWS